MNVNFEHRNSNSDSIVNVLVFANITISAPNSVTFPVNSALCLKLLKLMFEALNQKNNLSHLKRVLKLSQPILVIINQFQWIPALKPIPVNCVTAPNIANLIYGVFILTSVHHHHIIL